MRRAPALVIGVVVLFLLIGGVVVLRSVGGGGAARTFDLKVTGTSMSPNTVTVKQGDRVTLNITIDRKEEIHLHGYDIHFEAGKPGDVVSHSFTADKTGDFDLEIEDSGKEVGTLTVRP